MAILRGIKRRTLLLLTVPAVTFVLGAVITVWATVVSPSITDLNGNVGVGTTGPLYKLHIESASVSDTTYISLNQRNGYVAGAGNWVMFSQGAVPTQNFRIGYNNDDGSFQIRDMTDAKIATFQTGGAVKFEGTSVGDTVYLTLNQRNGYVPGAGNWIRFAQGAVPTQNSRIGWSDANQGFQIRDANDATIATFRTGGAIGVGTVNPTAMLHVAGNVQVDGNIAAKYQDVAEWAKVTGSPSEGTVVVIDTEDQDRLVTSNAPYDTRVAGVISTKPGLLLGEPGEGRAKVAHSGRVKVKVDAKYGSIAVGDLLVTSSTPGYAMRSEPVGVGGVAIHRPGTLIGKALEALAEGQGQILVLLTLQ